MKRMLLKPLLTGLPFILFAVGVTMIALGIWLGEPEAIFRKATVICMECIGIG